MRTKRAVTLIGAIASIAFLAPSASAAGMSAPTPASTLLADCRTSVGDTGGWAECRIDATWRVKSICNGSGDQETQWNSTNGDDWVRVYAKDCLFDIVDVRVEISG